MVYCLYGNFKKSIKPYSDAINIFKKAGCPLQNDDLKLKVTQIYINRCMSNHVIN